MKTKIKKLSFLATALCAVVAAAGLFGACGGKSIDYESLTWEGWNAIEESTWDSKTISYQIVSGDMSDPDGADHSNRTLLLFNLYDDNTMVIYQAGLYTTGAGMTDAAWVDQDRHIAWVYYGFWEQASGFMGQGTCLKLYYFASKADSSLTVPKEGADSWASQNDFCYRLEFVEDEAYPNAYIMDNANASEPMVTLGFNQMAEEWPMTELLVASTEVKYNTIQSWVDAYLADKADGWTEI